MASGIDSERRDIDDIVSKITGDRAGISLGFKRSARGRSLEHRNQPIAGTVEIRARPDENFMPGIYGPTLLLRSRLVGLNDVTIAPLGQIPYAGTGSIKGGMTLDAGQSRQHRFIGIFAARKSRMATPHACFHRLLQCLRLGHWDDGDRLHMDIKPGRVLAIGR